VAKRATASNLVLQREKLTIEQDDMPHHQIAGVRPHERLKALRLGQIARHRFFQQHRLAGGKQRPSDRHVRRGRTGYHPCLGFRLGNRLLQVKPAGDVWQSVSNRIDAGLASGHERDELRFGDSGQSKRMLPAELAKAHNTDPNGLEIVTAHHLFSLVDPMRDFARSRSNRIAANVVSR
jgi:hypothetical protein